MLQHLSDRSGRWSSSFIHVLHSKCAYSTQLPHVLGALTYYIFSELGSSQSSTAIFSDALERARSNPEVCLLHDLCKDGSRDQLYVMLTTQTASGSHRHTHEGPRRAKSEPDAKEPKSEVRSVDCLNLQNDMLICHFAVCYLLIFSLGLSFCSSRCLVLATKSSMIRKARSTF